MDPSEIDSTSEDEVRSKEDHNRPQDNEPVEDSAEELAHIIQEFKANPERFLRLQFLVCGQTGVGKSSLINSVLGYEICPVGDPGLKDQTKVEAFSRETCLVEGKHAAINGTVITIWDSPGLQDGTSDDKRYLQDMYDKCRNVDLVLYCFDMTTSRWTDQEETAIKLMVEKFEKEFWKKCILVLTKANNIRVPKKGKKNKRSYNEQLYKNFLCQFRERLSTYGVSQDIVDRIPAVAAGIVESEEDDEDAHNDRFLWYVSETTTHVEGERHDFLGELWLTCFHTLDGVGQGKILHITKQTRFCSEVAPNKCDSRMVDLISRLRNEKDAFTKQFICDEESQKILEDFLKEYESTPSPAEQSGANFMFNSAQWDRLTAAVRMGGKIGRIFGYVILSPLTILYYRSLEKLGRRIGLQIGAYITGINIDDINTDLKLEILS